MAERSSTFFRSSDQGHKCEHSPEILVLASGGIDSSALLAFYRHVGRPVTGVFIDYGQPAAVQELEAVTRVSATLELPVLTCRWNGLASKAPGLVVGRNAFLLLAALMEAPPSATTIAIGVHRGTPYSDCSSCFIEIMQSAFSVYGSRITVAAPFVEWTKADILAFAREEHVPLDLTFSCETGGHTPCGLCASCRDREVLNA